MKYENTKEHLFMSNQNNYVTIIFVHSGKAVPPTCMAQSLAIAYRIAPRSKIVVLANHDHINVLKHQLSEQLPRTITVNDERLQFVPIEDLKSGNLSEKFKITSRVDKEFREGFWLETANRFMLVADLMTQFKFQNCLHLENDNVLYFDPSEKLEIFRAHARFSVPFDRSRAIPGIVWYQDSEIANNLAHYIHERAEMPDFDVLRLFCDCGLYDAKPLPTMSINYASSRGLSVKNFSLGYEEFGGIFDAAAIGQYIGGVDPRNIAGDSRFFVNETSDFKVGEFDLIWEYRNNHRSLVLMIDGESIPIFSLHAHSKSSLGASPYNCLLIENENQLITGERLQEFADLTITSQQVTAFHGLDNIKTISILETPTKEIRKFLRKKIINDAPDENWIDKCQSNKTIFVYTHLIPYFKKYVAARISSPFILISHNSDDGIKIDDLDLLNHPFLVCWFAQNCEFSHEKLNPLPIGLTNCQWGGDKYSHLVEVAKKYQKKHVLYANFSVQTHESRQELAEVISRVKNITISCNLSYEEYLKELAQHKFCLCPRGNGIDTHRFWESQYVNTIPVIIKSDWTSAYSNLPVLLLDSWQELPSIDFNLAYTKISSTYFNRSSAYLLHHKIKIKNSAKDL